MVIDKRKKKNNNKSNKKDFTLKFFSSSFDSHIFTFKQKNKPNSYCIKLRRKKRCTYQKKKQIQNLSFYFVFEYFRCTKIRNRKKEKRRYDYYHSEVELSKTHGRFLSIKFAQN